MNFDELDVLEPPLPVTTVRDFITLEQHTAGCMQSMTDAGSDGEEVHAPPDEWFCAPAFYFTNPYAATGSGHDVRDSRDVGSSTWSSRSRRSSPRTASTSPWRRRGTTSADSPC
ncbi:MAG: hypothetical protein ACTH02_06235 [Corynebacterium sp.]